MRETCWRYYFWIKTFPFFRKSNFCILAFYKYVLSLPSIRFSKKWNRFYTKITSPTCSPHKITSNRIIFEKISKNKIFRFSNNPKPFRKYRTDKSNFSTKICEFFSICFLRTLDITFSLWLNI
jgi:hypothetical protein